MSEDWPEKWYREAFARSSAEKPKAEVWKRIEHSLNAWFKRWYQSSAASPVSEPKTQVWEALSAFVDNEILLRRQWRLRVLRGLSFLAIFSLLPLSLTDHFTQDFERAVPESAQLISDQPASTLRLTENQRNPNENALGVQQLALVNTDLPTGTNSLFNTIANDPSSLRPAESLLENIHALSTRSAEEIQSSSVPEQLLNDVALEMPRIPLTKWTLGAASVYQHSSLYNETTRMGLNSTSHISNESKPNVSIDLSLLRTLNSRSLLSVGIRMNDVKGQSYRDFGGSEYLLKTLICTYQTLSFSYHRSLLQTSAVARTGLEISAGVYGSYRTGIVESVGEEERQFLSPGIRKYDLGVQFGLTSTFRIKGPLQLTLGSYYTSGLMNIFKGVDKVPARFYSSFTASYGLSLGLRYQLK